MSGEEIVRNEARSLRQMAAALDEIRKGFDDAVRITAATGLAGIVVILGMVAGG